jgi:[glutamine synthetase] adenylyltransferase / [glutamine synthetase]-adenylyl-L-tyrosine phosphorylase
MASPPSIPKLLRQPGAWEEPERAAKLLARLPLDAGLGPAAIARLEELCARSADPDGALHGAARALQARKERLGGPPGESALEPLVAIAAASKFLPAHLAARPRLLDLLAHPRFQRQTRSAVSARQAALALLRGLRPDEPKHAAQLATRLRHHKVSEVLRIAARDLLGRARIPECCAELSYLACAALETAVRFHYARLCALHGPPEGRSPPIGRTLAAESGFCVLGMGKLGGSELNFSSDIDVVYVYDKDGKTQGGPSGPLTHFAFYARLAEEVTRAIGAALEGGFVFRVDLDLRPEGRSGPLVNAQRGLELYYEAQGAAWERFALLKARPVAGELPVGEEVLRRLQPFVYRKYLDLSAVEQMRALKSRAEREAARHGGLHLKLGPGGIREIEFFAQALQLLHGGKDANLRERGTLRALDRLLFAGLLSARDRDELGEAYQLLRLLEHRVQMVAERQTHSLPEDKKELQRLARRSGFASAAAMERELSAHRARVQAKFDDLLRVAGGTPDEKDPRAALAADPQASDEERKEAMSALGFVAPEASCAELSRLRRRRGTPFSPSAPPEISEAAPWLLAELSKAPDPDQALRHLADLFGTLSQPEATSRLLAGSPRTARLLLALFGSSDYLSRSLLRHPELIDQLVHRGSAPLTRSAADLRAALAERLAALPGGDVELALGEIRKLHNEEMLRIGMHDVAGALEPEAVGAQLADLADVCVGSCLALAKAEVQRRDGLPRVAEGPKAGDEAQLVVVALGKLGGRELGYHSDLDLLFLYSGAGETDGPRRCTNHEHFARLSQKLIGHLVLQLPEGMLYRIDARLRPSGSAGPLVVSFEALQRYHDPAGNGGAGARLWERQALLRARPVAGDFALFHRAQREVLDQSLFRDLPTRAREEAALELWAMRNRMEREIAAESVARYNSKLGRGGLVDVEFAVQFLQLVHGRAHPEVRSPSTTMALAALAEAGLLAPAEAGPLLRGWRFLRRLESRMRIVRDRPIDHLPTTGRELLLLARRLGYSGQQAGEGLLGDYARATKAVRAAFLRVLALPPGAAPEGA